MRINLPAVDHKPFFIASVLLGVTGLSACSEAIPPAPGDGITESSQGGSPSTVEPGLDVSNVVDFPAGVTVASPVGANGPANPNGGQQPAGPVNGAPLPPLAGTAGAPSATQPNLATPEPVLAARVLFAEGDPVDGEGDASAAPAEAEAVAAPPTDSAYAASALAIAEVLSGSAPIATRFDLGAFFVRSGNAPCYGPSLLFQNHPDELASPTSGGLPGGDLGIWTPSTESGEACAAAQLNARMRDVQAQVSMGLTGLAGLVAAYQSTGASWPDDVAPGASIDLTAEMAAAGVEGVSFNSATMSLDASGDAWSYAIDASYTNASGDARGLMLSLQHGVTDRDAGLFEGLLNYWVEDQFPDRNCRETASRDITLSGSVHYIKRDASNLVLQSRSATACGLGSIDASALLLDDPLSSAVLTGNAVNPSAGWADNFNVFTADFDPTSLLGLYSYAWQAGAGDSHTRVLAVGLETAAGGEAYFGFGDNVQTSLNGQINGFICNWAGPGNTHAPADFSAHAQRQFLSYDAASARYVVSSDASSNITYAPTNSCTYDGSGSFLYDRNVNGDMSDESVDTAAIMPTGTALAFDLMTIDAGEADIWEHILGRGYTLPSYP